MGTLAYRAPEVQTVGAVSEKSDVYSLGVSLLEVLNGGYADDGHDRRKLAQHVASGEISARLLGTDALKAAASGSNALLRFYVRLLTRMVAKSADARPSAAEIASCLAEGSAGARSDPGMQAARQLFRESW